MRVITRKQIRIFCRMLNCSLKFQAPKLLPLYIALWEKSYINTLKNQVCEHRILPFTLQPKSDFKERFRLWLRNSAAEEWSTGCHVSTPSEQKVIQTTTPTELSIYPPKLHLHKPAVRKTQCPGFLKFPAFWLSGHNVLGVCNPAVCSEVKGQKEGIHYP